MAKRMKMMEVDDEPQFESNGHCCDHGRNDCPICGTMDPSDIKRAAARQAARNAEQARNAAIAAAKEADRLAAEADALDAPAKAPAAPVVVTDPDYQAWLDSRKAAQQKS